MIKLIVLTLFAFAHAAPLPTGPTPGTDDGLADALAETERLFAQMDAHLKRLAAKRNVGEWGRGLIDLIRALPFVDFHVVEKRLRRLGLDVYLVAAPIKFAPAGVRARSVLGIPEGDLEYWLWIELDGREAMLKKLAEYGTPNEDENLRRLIRTGILARVAP